MEKSTPILLEHVVELEKAAEDILSDRRQIVDLDIRRQQTRQAQRELHKDKTNDKTWMCVGNMFIKLPKQQAKQLLDRDFNRIDAEISNLRSQLKPKVNRLLDIEQKEELRGFHLNPLSAQELESIKGVI